MKRQLLILFLILHFVDHSTAQVDESHSTLLDKANKSVDSAYVRAKDDPLKPIFHLQTKANWINDPNGPIYFNGEVHMFFQHNPFGDRWGNMSWGHAVSRDMVSWQHLPIVLTPTPGSYDKNGVFSGCAVNDNGVLTIMYTGVNPEVQCIATSSDNGRSFVKFEGNPVIAEPPVKDVTGFRDPFVWRDGEWWYCVIGSGIKEKGGTAFLYRSADLRDWEYLNPIAFGFGTMWECPNFFPLGEKWVLAVSPYGECKYTVGDFDGRHFTPGEWRRMDFGGRAGFYAPNCLVDERGRRIMWGWITGPGSEGAPWNGMLTVPRVLTLHDNNRIGVAPLPELEALRTKHYSRDAFVIEGNGEFILPEIQSNTFEMIVEFDPAGAEGCGVDVLCSSDGNSKERIFYDNFNLTLSSGDKSGEFQLLPNENSLTLHIFVDRSVIEVFANYRECLTRRVYPSQKDAFGVALFAIGGPVKIKKLDFWEINSIWSE